MKARGHDAIFLLLFPINSGDPTTQEPTSKPTSVPVTTQTTTKGTTVSPPTSSPTTVEPEDPCDGKNCHRGDCVVNNDDEAECKCDAGWHGDDCNTQDDPTTTTLAPTTIQPDPCENKKCNGTLCKHCTGECVVNDDNEAECVCEHLWEGNNCHNHIGRCTRMLCIN